MTLKKHTLVTGSNGFLGQSLYKYLESESYYVLGSVRKDSAKIATQNNVVVSSLSSHTDWSAALNNCDVVIHTAARAHVFNESSEDVLSQYREVNSIASVNLARQAVEFGVRRFIFVSSIGVNGSATCGAPFFADSEANPNSPYAISKLEAEVALWEVIANTSMELVVIRVPAIYGVNAPGNFGLIEKALKVGVPLPFRDVENKRSLIYLDNLTNFIGVTIKHDNAANNLFLVDDGEDLSTPEIIMVMGKLVGKKPRLFNLSKCLLELLLMICGRRGAIDSLFSDLQIDSSNTRHQLDWKPPFSPHSVLKI